MAKTPKTLQVSFGSFSCTLEGFDDPLQAMKAVTDYVRDLTARDPAFADRIGLGGTPASAADRIPIPAPPESRPEPQASARPALPAWPEPASPVPAPRTAVPEVPRPAAPPPGPALTAPPAAATAPPEAGEADDAPGLDPAAHPGLQKLLLASAEGDEEEELSRILSRADDQLADPEATRRRDVIAQLKAAVAATEAERALGDPDPGPEARQGAFRLDLNEAVRVHPPMAGGRAEASPLRLVDSQRVDATEDGAEDLGPLDDEDDEVPPVRHRGSFAAFAAEMGAASLPDLLEAAAAWLCFVDEAESVSRAQLLALASEALPSPPDREEGLRAFGTLLRQGRIATVAGGRYRVSEGSRFDPGRLAV